MGPQVVFLVLNPRNRKKDTTQEECKDGGRDQYSPGHPQKDPQAEEAEKEDSRWEENQRNTRNRRGQLLSAA